MVAKDSLFEVSLLSLVAKPQPESWESQYNLAYSTKRLIPAIIAVGLFIRVFTTLGKVIHKRLKAWRFLVRGRDIIQDGFTMADCMQWIMESLPQGRVLTPQRLVHETMAIWFGSIHAVAGVGHHNRPQDLCLHPKYLEPLRQDIDNHHLDFEHTAQGLPLLDSFIKESARLTPTEALSTRRYAVQSHTFSDGTHLNRGDWACTPLIAINKIPEYYPTQSHSAVSDLLL
ncbi:hypothetical protein QC761_0040050 [Podospora bellae-mahoneyi]|uniref:Uncharacterized protein n=1 Tax=Podospora bellae-mahoneyi TaxID=2093777 RepID=A0ABR0FQE0_9PEZI|nr:hypothetical protein QC761_0040050 [Podospora bellae-mahoneyi]